MGANKVITKKALSIQAQTKAKSLMKSVEVFKNKFKDMNEKGLP